MCADLSFCVGDKVLITDPLDRPEEHTSAGRRLGVVQSVSISLERPSDPPECMIGIRGPGSSTTKLRLFPSAIHGIANSNDSFVLASSSGRVFHVCQKLKGNNSRDFLPDSIVRNGSPSPSLPERHMRVARIFRYLLEENVKSMRDIRMLPKIQRKTGRRTIITFKDNFTLSEWESFAAHSVRVSVGHIKTIPGFISTSYPRFTDSTMRVEMVDFVSLLRSLGHFDENRMAKFVIASREVKSTNSIEPTLLVRVVGDYICQEPAASPFRNVDDGCDKEMLVTLGSSFTELLGLSILEENKKCMVLHRQNCQLDPRDKAYVEPLELRCDSARIVLGKLTEDTRQENRSVISGDKRKRTNRRFMGFQWTRKTRIDPHTLFYDVDRANEIIGEIQMCIPTLTFFGGSTASEIRKLSSEVDLSKLLSITIERSDSETM